MMAKRRASFREIFKPVNRVLAPYNNNIRPDNKARTLYQEYADRVNIAVAYLQV